MNGTAIALWYVLYNAKNKEYVGYGSEYGKAIHVYTSPGPIGPFKYKQPLSPVYGYPGDMLMVGYCGWKILVNLSSKALSSL